MTAPSRSIFHLMVLACLAGSLVSLSPGRETSLPQIPHASTAVPVKVTADGMPRDGKPYFVKGAGGSGSLEQLAARGANSIRTWTTNGSRGNPRSGGAKLGLTVSAGIWLEPEMFWFSYSNPEHCAKQAERVRKEVMRYRDHPALLAWGIGNEIEGDGNQRRLLAAARPPRVMVKELDPAHPTFTAVAGMSEAKADGLMNAHAPHLDYVGINTYGGVFGLRKHLENIGWKRPWMLTEWGPRGFWESPKTKSGAPLEQTSSEKAGMIREAYQNVMYADGGCLGSYVFVWGWKFEATATWFGVFTHEGETTAVGGCAAGSVERQHFQANRAPDIGKLGGVPKSPMTARQRASMPARRPTDPDGDPLDWHWAVLPEANKPQRPQRPADAQSGRGRDFQQLRRSRLGESARQTRDLSAARLGQGRQRPRRDGEHALCSKARLALSCTDILHPVS